MLTIAHSIHNADTAAQLAHLLAGIEIQLISDQDLTANQFSMAVKNTEGPIVLLVTDNFLKSETCMTEALQTLVHLMRQSRVAVLIANGRATNDNGVSWEPVPTHIDRVVYAIQYMNFWQTAYLEQSSHYGHLSEDDRIHFEPQLEATHAIANQMGDFISALRDADPILWEDAVRQNGEQILRLFNLQRSAILPELNIEKDIQHADIKQVKDINEQYAELLASAATPPPPVAELSVPPIGAISFRPAADAPLTDWSKAEAQPVKEVPDTAYTDEEEERLPTSNNYIDSEVARTIQDAWLWLEKGHIELGLEVFRLASEQYPEHQQLKLEFEAARAQFGGEGGTLVPEPDEITPEDEAKTYETMGDNALEQEDFLMAKYCWDRVVEHNPNYPGIYRKLGLLTSTHLAGYTETSITYLEKALEQNPDDSEVRASLIALGIAVPEKQPDSVVTIETPMPEPPPAAVAVVPDPVETVTYTPAPERVVTTPTVDLQPTAQIVTQSPQSLVRKIALITGATSGIGKATALEFARNGWNVIITGRRADRLAEFKIALEQQFPTEVLTLCFDIRHNNEVERAVYSIPTAWQEIDVLVNNAGLAKGLAPIQEGNLEHWETMIDTNIKGLLYITRCISPGMVARRRGHIINLSSSAGKEAYPNGGVYCATKFAVEALTRGMRMDLYKHNIRVSQVSPGHVEETEFAITRFDGDAEKAKIYDDFQPLTARDVAEAIYFMASRPAHVNVQDIWMFGTQQASATMVDRSGR